MSRRESSPHTGGSFLNEITWFKPYTLMFFIVFTAFFPSSLFAQRVLVAPEPFVLFYDDPEMQDMVNAAIDSIKNLIMYDDFRSSHYLYEKMQYDSEMLLREKYLLGLFSGIVQEVRKGKGFNLPLDTYEDLLSANPVTAENPFDLDLHLMPLADEFLRTSEYEREEYHQKLIFAETLKSELIRRASTEEISRMFAYDLKLAHDSYNSGEYELAILRFNHILALYPYKVMDDILFYRAESEYASKYYLSAAASYRRLIDTYPDSEYLGDSYARLLYIYAVLDRFDSHLEIWQEVNNHDFGFATAESLLTRRVELEDSLKIEGMTRGDKKALKQDLEVVNELLESHQETLDLSSRVYYNAGYGFYLNGDYEKALEAFAQLPLNTPNIFKSSFLIGDALIKSGRFEEAVDPLKLIAEIEFYPETREAILAQEALIELGYCLFKLERLEESRIVFSVIDEESDRYKDALLGLAWIDYKLNNYAAVDSLTNLLHEKYPDDPVYYEAAALGSYNRELLGMTQTALEEYDEIIELLNSISLVHKYIAERRILQQRLYEISEMEQAIAVSNDPKLFQKFMAAKSEIKHLYKLSKISETAELNSQLQLLLLERDTLNVVMKEYFSFENTVDSLKNYSIQRSYEKLGKKLQDIDDLLALYTTKESLQFSPVQTVVEGKYSVEVQDSVLARAEDELLRLHAVLSKIPESRKYNIQDRNLGEFIRQGIVEHDLVQLRQRKEVGLVALSESRMIEVSEDIESWRDYAYKRSATVELDFDHLVDQMDLLQSLTDHINQLEQVITEKEIVAEQEAAKAAAEAEAVKLNEAATDSLDLPEMESPGEIQTDGILQDSTDTMEEINSDDSNIEINNDGAGLELEELDPDSLEGSTENVEEVE